LTFQGPDKFFNTLDEQGLGKSVLTLLIASSIQLIAVIAMFGILNISLSRSIGSVLSVGVGTFLGVFTAVLSFGGSFVYSGISHIIVKYSGGTRGYSATYNAVSYSLVPGVLLSFIPFLGFAAYIYSIVMMIFGISKYQNITKGKSAAAAALVPILIIIVAFILFVLFLFFSLRNLSF
jgi:hypothetical protein